MREPPEPSVEPEGTGTTTPARHTLELDAPARHALPMRLWVMPGRFAIAQLAADAAVPAWASEGAFSCVARTPEELSVIVSESAVPPNVRAERDWVCVAVVGPLPFETTGIVAGLAQTLAEAEIPILTLSTYHTDYVLIRSQALERSLEALRAAGHEVSTPPYA